MIYPIRINPTDVLMELHVIENFIRQEFPRVGIEDRQDLINSAWLFLAEHNVSEVSELSVDIQEQLKKCLGLELNQVNWREISAEDYQRYMFGDEFTSNEDELLSKIKKIGIQQDTNEISEELELAAAEFESRCEEIRTILPPVLFEALTRCIDPKTPINWTKGFEDHSLKFLCWRALVRITWVDT